MPVRVKSASTASGRVIRRAASRGNSLALRNVADLHETSRGVFLDVVDPDELEIGHATLGR